MGSVEDLIWRVDCEALFSPTWTIRSLPRLPPRLATGLLLGSTQISPDDTNANVVLPRCPK